MNKGIILIILQQVLVGSSPIIYKSITQLLPSSLLVMVRYSIASVFLLLVIGVRFAWKGRFGRLTGKQLATLLLLGFISAGMSSWLYLVAIRKIGAALSTLIVNLEIPIGIALAAVILKEELTGKFVALVSYILVGFVLLVAKIGTLSLNSNLFIGVLAAMVVAFLWGLATVLGKILLKQKITPIVVTFFRYLAGASFDLLLSWITLESLFLPLASMTRIDWLKIGYLAVVVSGTGLVLYYRALRDLAVRDISVLFVISPLTATLLGVATGELLSLSQWLGAGVVLSGIGLLLKQKAKVYR